MDSSLIEEWGRKDLWSEGELAMLCCGLDPDMVGRTEDDIIEINKAAKDARYAVLAKVLPVICPTDASDADRMYGKGRFFKLADAIPWAKGHFDKFPGFTAPEPEGIAPTLRGDHGREGPTETTEARDIRINARAFELMNGPDRLNKDEVCRALEQEEGAASRLKQGRLERIVNKVDARAAYIQTHGEPAFQDLMNQK